MKSQFVPRDERTTAVENESYRLAYLLMSFGLLVIVMYRGFFLDESSWDLLALVVLGGAVSTLYQGRHHVLSEGLVKLALVTMVIAAVVAGILAFIR